MRNLLYKDKKAVSIMIGYVLLIVIAISIGIIVFAYLKLFVPKDEPECKSDISLSIEKANCSAQQIDLTLRNRGLFSLQGLQIRVGDPNRLVRTFLNEEDDFVFQGDPNLELEPGEEWNRLFQYSYASPSTIEVEVQAIMAIEEQRVLCEEAVVNQIIDCT